jgi:hypothetical protein
VQTTITRLQIQKLAFTDPSLAMNTQVHGAYAHQCFFAAFFYILPDSVTTHNS